MSAKKRVGGGHWHAPPKKKKKITSHQAVTGVEAPLKTAIAKPSVATLTPDSIAPTPQIEVVSEVLIAKYQAIITDIKLIGKLAAAAVILLIVLSFII